MKVSVDEWLCAGHGLCEAASPEVFEVNDDGIAVVLQESPGESLLSSVKDAVRLCPADAILIKENS